MTALSNIQCDWIDNKTYRSRAYDHRISYIILHYTEVNFEKSIELLTGSNVSVHYLIPDPKDPSFLNKHQDLKVFSLLDENLRGWHAGISSWQLEKYKQNNINNHSIGIEIVNPGVSANFPSFNVQQMELVIKLIKLLQNKYPAISAKYILGHSDIAWTRKIDPGPAFPWRLLYENGIGMWYDEIAVTKRLKYISEDEPSLSYFLKKIQKIGYDLSQKKTDADYKKLISAFQMHFRANKYDGVLDAETIAIAENLVDRYF